MPASARSPRARRAASSSSCASSAARGSTARSSCPGTIRRSPSAPEAPQFHLRVKGERLLCGPLTELTLGRGYVQGDLDIAVEGAIDGPAYPANAMAAFDVRDEIRFGMSPRQALRLAAELALTAPTRVNARAVRHHYSLGDDFYLTFLDREYHFYSQCVFEHDDDTLEVAAERKLECMRSALDLQPGMRILDIGGGWGGLVEYCEQARRPRDVPHALARSRPPTSVRGSRHDAACRRRGARRGPARPPRRGPTTTS